MRLLAGILSVLLQLNLVTKFAQYSNRLVRRIANNCSDLGSSPDLTTVVESGDTFARAVYTEFRDKHLEHVLETGTKPVTSHRKMKIRNSRHVTLRRAALPARSGRSCFAHDVRECVAVSVDLDVRGRHVVCCVTVIFVSEQRLPFTDGVDLDPCVVDGKIVANAVERALVRHDESKQWFAINAKKDPLRWSLANREPLSAVSLRHDLGGEGITVRSDVSHR